MDYDEMKAGREIDALVAERVMGWTRYSIEMHPSDNRTIGGILYCPPDFPHDHNAMNVVPDYSTEVAKAWLVVEKLARDEHDSADIGYLPDGSWRAYFRVGGYRPFMDQEGWAEAPTASLAICRAALKATESAERPPNREPKGFLSSKAPTRRGDDLKRCETRVLDDRATRRKQ